MTAHPAARAAILIVKIAVVGLCFVYIGLVLARNLDQLRQTEFTLHFAPLAASFPLAVAYLLGRALVWRFVARRMVGRYSLRDDMLSWLSSLVGKYLPGKVFLLLGRVYFYRRRGADSTRVSVAFLVEACCSTIAASVIFLVAAGWQEIEALHNLLWAAVVAVALLAALTHPAVLKVVINAALRIVRRPPIGLELRWWDIWWWTLLIVFDWLILGTGFYLLINALIELPLTHLPYVTGSFAVAGVVGILVLFAPSGIGVREGVMTAALTPILGPAVSAVIALIARVWMTLAEALCAGVALWLIRGQELPALAAEAARPPDASNAANPSTE